ncbi:hypothetical protein [Kitasatospora sp. NPDC101183]|uniref:hypothetical protein n=1 Tax=Kitasatospora sp. NPDC101183 TaxID=3364100 RepID=UPI0038191B54
MATSTTTLTRGKRRAAVALAGLIAFTGLGLATATTASATGFSKKCYAEFYYEGAWHKIQVKCG